MAAHLDLGPLWKIAADIRSVQGPRARMHLFRRYKQKLVDRLALASRFVPGTLNALLSACSLAAWTCVARGVLCAQCHRDALFSVSVTDVGPTDGLVVHVCQEHTVALLAAYEVMTLPLRMHAEGRRGENDGVRRGARRALRALQTDTGASVKAPTAQAEAAPAGR
jgi:hypothetical protein